MPGTHTLKLLPLSLLLLLGCTGDNVRPSGPAALRVAFPDATVLASSDGQGKFEASVTVPSSGHAIGWLAVAGGVATWKSFLDHGTTNYRLHIDPRLEDVVTLAHGLSDGTTPYDLTIEKCNNDCGSPTPGCIGGSHECCAAIWCSDSYACGDNICQDCIEDCGCCDDNGTRAT
jgi:hypothetical protein